MRTSAAGVRFLERHEGVVLRAYRDPVGVWTIGAGLTKASGVVDPGPGMEITREEASSLLTRALGKYERDVSHAMTGARQHEFDGGVSFHFNTGAIGRASWVRAWLDRNAAEMRERLGRWNKGGGRVLPGLTRRRAEEARVILFGQYGHAGLRPRRKPNEIHAARPLAMTPPDIDAARAGFERLGYSMGPGDGEFDLEGVKSFQRDHDLTVDGIVGRATLSTLQRRLDARAKAAQGGAVGAVGAGETAVDVVPAAGWEGPALLIAAALFGLWMAWRYRDVIAAKISHKLPRLAAWLRSIK